MLLRLIIAAVGVGVSLGGCAHGPTVGSVAGGECRVFERPPYAVRGKTQYDQDVADNFVESGVSGCNWKRPAARPASIEGRVVSAPVTSPKKKGIIRRIKEKFIAPRPIEPVPYIAAQVAQPAPPQLPPALRDPVDDLLNGN